MSDADRQRVTRTLQVVIPARNEAMRLPRTLELMREHLAVADERRPDRVEVLVVDNASTDETVRLARSAHSAALPVRVLHCAEPGKGAAVRAGIAATDAGFVAFMDADGATSLSALDVALGHLASGADVAIASRAHPGSVTSNRQRAARTLGAALYRRAARQVVPGIGDTQCGFKLMRGELARRAFRDMRTNGFSFDVEMLARLRERGAEIIEFPVTWTDVPGSTFSPARHGVAAFAELARISWLLRPGTGRPRGLLQVDLPHPLLAQQYLAPLHV